MKYSKYITTTFILVFMIGSAAASTADLQIFPEESTAEVNSFTSFEVSVENTGGVRDVYTLSSNQREVDIAPRKIELEPNQEKTVNVWYNPRTGADEGRYSFSVQARSRATGDSYSVSGVANVIKEHNVGISVNQASQVACLGDEAIYEIDVENQGIQPEEFQLRSEFGSFEDRRVNLQEGETRTVRLSVSSDEPVVREEFRVTASSTTSYATDSERISFEAENCWASQITPTQDSYDLPARTESVIEFNLENTGTRTDVFELSSNVGEVVQEEIELESGESETVGVAVTPQGIETQEVELTAESNIVSSASVSYESFNSMDSEITLSQSDINICENEQGQTNVQVENTGEAAEDFRLGSNIGELGHGEISLRPGAESETTLTFEGSEFEEGSENDFTVTSRALSFGQPTSEADGQLTVENCWDLNMNIVPRVESAGTNQSTLYEIQLRNPGTRENTYELSYDAPHWVDLRPTEVTVAPGEMETAYIYAGVPFQKQGEVRITATAVGTEVEQTREARLKIGQDVTEEDLEEALRDDEEEVELEDRPGVVERITGNAVDRLDQTGTIVASIVIALLVTAGILYS